MTTGGLTELPGSIPLATRMGREIPNEQVPEAAPEVEERYQKVFRKKYSLVIQRRPPSGQYNCHGLTFASRRTGIHDPPVVEMILTDDGYRRISLADVEPGDVVVYYDMGEVSHTGVVLSVVAGEPDVPAFRRARVLSKWGHAGEYMHLDREGEYAQHDISYWTDRP